MEYITGRYKIYSTVNYINFMTSNLSLATWS